MDIDINKITNIVYSTSDSIRNELLKVMEELDRELHRELDGEADEFLFLYIRMKIVKNITDRIDLHKNELQSISDFLHLQQQRKASGLCGDSIIFEKAIGEADLLTSLSKEILMRLSGNMLKVCCKDDNFNEIYLKNAKGFKKDQIVEISRNLTTKENDHCILYRADLSKFSERVLDIIGNENMDSYGPNLIKIKEAADSFNSDLIVLFDRYFAEELSNMFQPINDSVPYISTAVDVSSLTQSQIKSEINRLKSVYESGFKKWYSDAYRNIAIYFEILLSCISICKKAFIAAQNFTLLRN